MSKEFKFNPFQSLKGAKAQPKTAAQSRREADLEVARQADLQKIVDEEEDMDENLLFLRAVNDVEVNRNRDVAPEKETPTPNIVDEELEVQRELMRLVSGQSPFDISYTDEFVEGSVRDLPGNIMKKLRKGEYSIQAKLDLHGATKAQAREEIEQFIVKSQHQGLRSVLVIHGRGFHSKDNIPVLKNSLKAWFERGRGTLGKAVLAFTTARPVDGGLGAMYVLIRKPKQSRM